MNLDAFYALPAHFVAKLGFSAISQIPTNKRHEVVAGLAYALVLVADRLGVNGRDAMTTAERWLRDSQTHDTQAHNFAAEKVVDKELTD